MTEQSQTIVAVLGLGTMGHGIVQAFASKGIQVHAYDEWPHARRELLGRVRTILSDFVRVGLHPAGQVESMLSRITVHESMEAACRSATFVVEAVREDLAVKQALLAEVESHVGIDTILASNSSSFPISESGTRLKHPEQALVTHWFNPPHIVPTVEIVPSPLTREDITQAALALHRRIGKQAIVIRREVAGFLVNRVQVAVMREVWDLLEKGVASAEDIDAAIRGSMGFRLAALGPLRIHDFGGLDIQASVYRNLCPQLRSDTTLPTVVEKMVAAGHFGFKTGEGFYAYPPEQADRALAERDERYLALLKLLHADSTPTK
ncbi:MAG: 3-hydroxyacyl-CoA dehydrogenase family protein [Gemmataceae bacterium]|nr:3-hydroxyacyl-CoA dehydrogenase family protein [Gemmataceae bacterium]